MKTNPVFKTVLFLLCAVSASMAFWAGLFSLRYWGDMWTEANFYASDGYYSAAYDMESRAEELLGLLLAEQRDDMTYARQERLTLLRELLAPENTNYRFQLRVNDTGDLLASNMTDVELGASVSGVNLRLITIEEGNELRSRDYIEWVETPIEGVDGLMGAENLTVWTGEEFLSFPDSESPPGYNEYGWYHDIANHAWEYSPSHDRRVSSTDYALRSGVLTDMTVRDAFWTARAAYNQWRANLPLVGIAALVSLAVCLLTLALLCAAAGRRTDSGETVPGWVDRIPLDILALAAFCLFILGGSLGDPIASGLNIQMRPYRIVGLVIVSSIPSAAVLGLLLTTVARVKSRTFLSSILIFRACAWCWKLLGRGLRAVCRGVTDMFHTISMNVRLGLVFLVYLGLNALLALGLFRSYSPLFYFIGLVLFNGCAFWLGCRWIDQWRVIRENTRRIVGGDSGVQIDTRHMYRDLKNHAEQLNDLGTAIDHAVDERLKSEHFKAELITNVSHDLKTPLTSIINYVDLLKKLDIDDPKAREYLEVLDRKGQRLKKLTEDLVEASKASTGNVTVNAVHMDLVEFTQQAVAEYEDRLLQQKLTLITKMADHPVYINADGRHMWRILDNLLGNCVKYALEGTRVYLDVVEWDGKASISLKNISREALDVDPESLTERFVRGDESRTTEGSGLGLSIARSLTEVQGGTFRIATDGDLFKAAVFFPAVLALEENRPEQQA